jgi:hypothetical protein
MEIFIYLLAGLILFVISLGLILKILMIGINILSLPTFIGLMYFEDIHNFKKLKINKPPKNGLLRLIMNLFSSFITMIFIDCIANLIKFSWSDNVFIQKLISGKVISLSYSIVIVISLIVIYLINYFSEENTEDSFTKIDNLDLKPFFKLW